MLEKYNTSVLLLTHYSPYIEYVVKRITKKKKKTQGINIH